MQDLDILDGLQAAQIDEAKPEQDHPFRNINIEDLTSAEGIVVGMQEQAQVADKAAFVASESRRIAKEGLIDVATARNLSTEVPQIMGTPDDPVSYSSVPTKIGVSKAVEILENAASSSRDAAVVKMADLIDRAITTMQSSIDKFQSEWVGALASYGASRAKATAEFGGLPEESTEVYLEGQSGEELGLSKVKKFYKPVDGLLSCFIAAVAPYINNSWNTLECKFIKDVPIFSVSDRIYTAQTAIDGMELENNDKACTHRTLSQWLSSPFNHGEDNSKVMIELGFKCIERLKTIAKSMKVTEEGAVNEAEFAQLTAKALRITTLTAQIGKALEGFVVATNAAAAFYEKALAMSVVSTKAPIPARERFIAKRKRLS